METFILSEDRIPRPMQYNCKQVISLPILLFIRFIWLRIYWHIVIISTIFQYFPMVDNRVPIYKSIEDNFNYISL